MKEENKIETYIENSIKEIWLDEYGKVDSEILKDIQDNLERLSKIFALLDAEVEKIKKNVEGKEKRRKKRRKKQISENNERENNLKEKIKKISEEKVGRGELKEIDSHKTFVIDGFPDNEIIKYNSKTPLEKYSYHLAIMENSGRIFWLRPSQTRITQFRWKLEFPAILNDINYRVSLFAPVTWRNDQWDSNKTLTNLSITLSDINFGYPICEISVWCDLEKLEIINIKTLSEESIKLISSKLPSNSKFTESLREIKNWVLDNKKKFDSIIIQNLLNPKFDKKLESEDIELFLQPNKTYKLKIGKTKNTPIFIFRELKKYETYI